MSVESPKEKVLQPCWRMTDELSGNKYLVVAKASRGRIGLRSVGAAGVQRTVVCIEPQTHKVKMDMAEHCTPETGWSQFTDCGQARFLTECFDTTLNDTIALALRLIGRTQLRVNAATPENVKQLIEVMKPSRSRR